MKLFKITPESWSLLPFKDMAKKMLKTQPDILIDDSLVMNMYIIDFKADKLKEYFKGAEMVEAWVENAQQECDNCFYFVHLIHRLTQGDLSKVSENSYQLNTEAQYENIHCFADADDPHAIYLSEDIIEAMKAHSFRYIEYRLV